MDNKYDNYNKPYKGVEVPEWLKEMPKTDLHCHLGGSMRIDTILDLAEKNGVPLNMNEEQLRNHIVYKKRSKPSLTDYLAGFKTCESVLTTAESFSRAAFEVAEDAAKENVKIFEL
jgi:adenosine deaminase